MSQSLRCPNLHPRANQEVAAMVERRKQIVSIEGKHCRLELHILGVADIQQYHCFSLCKEQV